MSVASERLDKDGLRTTQSGLVTAAATIAFVLAMPAMAEDIPVASSTKAEVPAGDELVVIGTRRSGTTVLTSSTPIDVVSSKQLEQTGASNLSKELEFEVPSFHFTQDNPSTSVQYAVKGASLHGLGPDQTLVLIDGVRLHLNSQVNTGYLGYGRGTQVADIDIIPADAVDRVEVLRDGASAQYGSDAIAGVINFVLKSDDELKFSAQAGSYSALGQGLRTNITGSWGKRFSNGGFIHATVEGVNAEAVDIAINDTRQYYFSGDPREATVNRHWFYGSGKYRKIGTMVNGELPLTDSLTAFGYMTGSYRENYGFANFRRPNDDGNVRAIYPNGFQPIQLVKSTDYEGAVGLRHEGGVLGKLTLTASYGRSKAYIYTYNTVNASFGTASATAGSSGTTYNDDINVTLDQVRDFDLPILAGPLTVASGLAYRNERYEIVAGDPFTWAYGRQPILDGPDAGKPAAIGSQGASGFQPADAGVTKRDVFGGYLDVSAKLTHWFDLDVAGRTEHYSDFGWTTNGKASARAQVTPWLALRGTVGTGFRAPSIGQLAYSRTTGVFINNVQYIQRIVPADSPEAAALGAKPLRPEKSTNVSAGIVFQPLPKTVLTVDAYRVKVDHRIVLTGTLSGTLVTQVLTAAGYPNLQGAQFFTNALNTRTKGIDIVARHGMTVWRGNLDLSTAYSWTDTNITHIEANPAQLSSASIVLIDRQQQGFITSGQPKSKLIFSGSYAIGPVTFNATDTRYGTYSFINQTTPSLDQKFGRQWVLGLSGSVKLNPQMRVDVGADNVLNSKPDQQIPGARNPIVSLYSSLSPVGAYGTFLYGRITFTF